MTPTLLMCALLPVAVAQSPHQQAPGQTASPNTPILLWPQGAPNAAGKEAKDKPSILVYRAPLAGRADKSSLFPAIVICPGGGYGHLANDHEGHQIARWLNTIGITGVILNYRHRGKGYGHPAPLQDAQRALRMVRHNADAWKIDQTKIGVLGFSAGGHLASSASVHHDSGDTDSQDPIEQQSCRPDFSILCYAVIAFGQPFTHKGSQRNLLGSNPPQSLITEMSSERQVDANTPPTFLWHTTADGAVPPQNSVAFYLALLEHKVPCEMHMFEQGRHGIGLGKGMAAENWPELCRRWLMTRKVLPK